MNLKKLTLHKARQLLDSKTISSYELVSETLDRIATIDPKLNSYITVTGEEALREARAYDKASKSSHTTNNPLGGIPISVKDVYCTKGIRTTCASNILTSFIPPYESTVTKRLRDAGAIIIGKTNLDEFCHGSSTETSAFGTTKNPWDLNRLPGGSSGGSAASVSAGLAVASVGTETAGSIRQPASWCGLVGMKPTYGRSSRYGVIAMASSLDTPGPLTKDVRDAARMLHVISGKDPLDATSFNKPVPKYEQHLDKDMVRGLTIGLPKEFVEVELEDGIREFPLEKSIHTFEKLGAKVQDISLIHPKYAMSVYTIIARSEISSNLARFTGIRYGTPPSNAGSSYKEYSKQVRSEGFGDEAKRRIMTGTHTLSAGYHDQYYTKAVAVRNIITKAFESIFSSVDIIIGPTTPTVAMKVGSTKGNPLFGEIADMLVEHSALAHLPGISIPCGFANGLPIGLQIFGPKHEEQRILNTAYAFEQATPWHTMTPDID